MNIKIQEILLVEVLRLLDSKESAMRKLSFIAWDVNRRIWWIKIL